METKHAQSPQGDGEFTVCGMAFDAHESGDSDEPIVFAGAGEAVTCHECRRLVVEFRAIKLGRLPSNAELRGRPLADGPA